MIIYSELRSAVFCLEIFIFLFARRTVPLIIRDIIVEIINVIVVFLFRVYRPLYESHYVFWSLNFVNFSLFFLFVLVNVITTIYFAVSSLNPLTVIAVFSMCSN